VAAVTGAGSASAAVIGADNTYVYYDVTTTDYPNFVHAYAASATGTINSGAEIDGVDAFFTFAGVIGTSLFGNERQFCSDCMEMCTIIPIGAGSCRGAGVDPDTPGTGLGSGALVAFKNSSQSYFVAYSETYLGNSPSITWYHANNSSLAQTFSDSITASSWSYFSPFAYNSAVYWIRVLYDASNAVTQAILYSVNADSPGAKTALSANLGVDTYRIIDANAYSVLLTSQPLSGSLYRVALPGSATAVPPLLASPGSAYVTGATEDATGVYWLQSDGNLYRCTPPGCADKKTLATGQTPVGDLYQNDAAIFWSNNGVIMRLAKGGL
jgi:hypothetical protein